MKLKDIMTVYGKNEVIIEQGTKVGTSGTSPVMTYSGWNDWKTEVPEKLWDREVKQINACPCIRYDRPSAVLNVILIGYEEL